MKTDFTYPFTIRYGSLRDKILLNCIPESNSGCWLWTGSQSKDGYGKVSYKRISYRAHRASFSVFKSDPGECFVCHKCDTPLCVNPDHLWLGNAKSNGADRAVKGRAFIARSWPKPVLSEDDVIKIRCSNDSVRALCRQFGAGCRAIRSAKNRETWKHIK